MNGTWDRVPRDAGKCMLSRTSQGLMLIVAVLCALAAGCGGSSNRQASQQPSPESPGAQIGQPAACDNPFYPAGSSSRWQYSAKFAATPLTLTVRRTGLGFGTFTDRLDYSDGSSTEIQWSCIQGGGLWSSALLPIDLTRYPTVFKLKNNSGSGLTLPASGDWAVGYHWTGTYGVSGQRSGGSSGVQEASGTVAMDNSIVSSGKVTVPAGTFDAFQIDSNVIERLTVGSGNTSGNATNISIKISAWYAKDVGLVKVAFSGDPGTGGEELTSFTK